jgi:hypothetical protein
MSATLITDTPRADFRHAPLRKFWFDDEAEPARTLAGERRHRQTRPAGARHAFESLYAGLAEQEPELLD